MFGCRERGHRLGTAVWPARECRVMKTTCICCGKRASHESIGSVRGKWYRCHSCNYAWRGFQGYMFSVIANIWWPIKGPAHDDATPRPLSDPHPPTSRSQAFPGEPGVVQPDLPSPDDGPGGSIDRPERKLRTQVVADTRCGNQGGRHGLGGIRTPDARIVWDGHDAPGSARRLHAATATGGSRRQGGRAA
jgi:hypothetical protein